MALERLDQMELLFDCLLMSIIYFIDLSILLLYTQ